MVRQKNIGAEIENFIRESFELLGRYFKGRLLISLIIGALCFIVLWIIGIRLKLLISIIVALTTLVPYIGPIVAMILTALIVVFQAPIYVPLGHYNKSGPPAYRCMAAFPADNWQKSGCFILL